MNKVIQTITFVNDPEIKNYGTDGKLVSFRGAVNKRYHKEGEPDADFFKYTAFGKTAEFIAKYFMKGKKALIEGEINNNNFEKEGVKHYGVKIIVNNIEFYGSKSDGEMAAKTDESETTPKASSKPVETTSYDEFDDF